MIYHVEIAGKGGITQYTYNLVSHLKWLRPQREIGIIAAKEYELENLPRSFRVFRLFNRFKTDPFKLLHFFIFKIKHRDIVHFQLSSFPPFVLGLIFLLKMFCRPAIIVTVHNVVSHESSFADKITLKTIYHLADRLIVHAQQNKAELIRQFSIPEDKVHVIPHGNYLFAQEISPKKRKTVQKNRFELLFFGYIREYKGLDLLLHALKIVVDQNPRVLLHIVGKPHEDFTKYRQLIASLALEPYLNLKLDYVPIDEVQTYFIRADVVVLPYKRISQSGVIFMAYAFGKPVIATNVGGIPEVVEQNKSGILIPAQNKQALAEAILKLMQNPELAKKMGARALELSRTKYSWQAIARKTWKLYDSLSDNPALNRHATKIPS